LDENTMATMPVISAGQHRQKPMTVEMMAQAMWLGTLPGAAEAGGGT